MLLRYIFVVTTCLEGFAGNYTTADKGSVINTPLNSGFNSFIFVTISKHFPFWKYPNGSI